MSPDSHAAAVTNAPAGGGTNAPAKVSPRFAITRYEVEGNTVLTTNIIDKVLGDHVGPECTYDTLRDAIKELQLTYRGRGFVTVSVTLPVQSITNGLVRLKVVEGKLANIRVTGNRWFSSNNVMSSLPSLKTNLIINSAWFQTELDQANGNRDRQIYPIVGPGPEPGTTDLQLKVKDRLPLHGRWELNNKGSPGTPDLRMDASVQYANLWQLEHQVGLQYNFTPGSMKSIPAPLYDEPLISSYSGFYRLPLFRRQALLDNEAFTSSDFGYDPITRKFKAPPASGRPEMIFFASRSSTDSGVINDPTKFAVGDLSNLDDRLFITQSSQRQNVSVNEGVGLRLQGPLPKLGIFQQSLSVGPDWKHYYQKSSATNIYKTYQEQTQELHSPADRNLLQLGPPVLQSPDLPESVNDYLLVSASWTISEADKWGSTAFSLTPAVSVADLRNTQSVMQHATGGTNVVSDVPLGRFVTVNAGLVRDQVIFEEWLLSLRANGQWANKELTSAEQFGLGGTTGVRGYRDGEEYGDSGWRVLMEPKTPSIELGNWQGESIIRGRFSLFTDYGERYLQHPQGRVPSVAEWGAGFGMVITVTENFEARAAVAWPLLDTPAVKAGTGRIHFSISAQF
jgi:hemolysin activation/secretion protein